MMIKSLRRRFILFSVLVIGGIIVLAALMVFLEGGGMPPEHNPVERYVVSLSLVIGLVFLGSWILSGFAVKPIQAAWQKQLDFTADASHELRTPIAVIQTNLELVMDSPGETVESQMKWLRNIEMEHKRMTRLVEDLLTLSRADTGQQTIKIDIEKEPFLLDAAVSETLRPFIPVAAVKGIGLMVSVKEDTLFYGSQKQMMQLVRILVDNALCYTDSGQVTVTVAENEKDTVLTVSDTGCGIAPEHLDKIFDRFYRVPDTRGMHQNGSGLGLSIAKWITRENRGAIRAASTPGVGTTFTLVFPNHKFADNN